MMSCEATLLAREITSMPASDDGPVISDARASVSGVLGSVRALQEEKNKQ